MKTQGDRPVDDIDQLLGRLGGRGAHPGLADIDHVVMARIADAQRQGQGFQVRLGAFFAGLALVAGVAGGGASVAFARHSDAISPMALAPSSLLIPRE
jgi:hypothetical protein